MINSFKAIIFDFDGTLYDFKGVPLKLCLSSIKNILKIRADRIVKRELKGIDFSSSVQYEKEYSNKMAKITSLKEDKVLSWYNNCYIKNMTKVLQKHYCMRSNLEDLFLFLNNQNIKITIFSDYPNVKERANAIGFTQKMWNCVFNVYSSQEFGAQKPATRPFLEIAKNLQEEPQNILVVGDRDDTDGEGARNSRMNFIQIKTHKTKVIDTTHKVLSWQEFFDYILNKK